VLIKDLSPILNRTSINCSVQGKEKGGVSFPPGLPRKGENYFRNLGSFTNERSELFLAAKFCIQNDGEKLNTFSSRDNKVSYENILQRGRGPFLRLDDIFGFLQGKREIETSRA